jgi:hypothetical protein
MECLLVNLHNYVSGRLRCHSRFAGLCRLRFLVRSLPLHRLVGAAPHHLSSGCIRVVVSGAFSHLVKEWAGLFSIHYSVGHGICLPLIRVAALSQSAGQLHAATLLHHMRCFVRRCVQVRSADERDMVAYGVTHCV